MPWCIRCGTALSQHELVGTDSYRELTHRSVYLTLPIVDRPDEHFLVWTTTPWTLPANVALAVHPELEYVKIEQGDDRLLSRPHDGFLKAVRGGRHASRAPSWSACVTRDRSTSCPQQASSTAVIAWEEVGEEEGTASSTSPRLRRRGLRAVEASTA